MNLENKTKKELKEIIKKLIMENNDLKKEIKDFKFSDKTFYTLKQKASFVDLGELKKDLPKSIPDHKKWKASDYPKDWIPEKKIDTYLKTFWKNYPVTQSYFSNVKGGQSFYKYLKRNDLLHKLPNTFQIQLKKRIEEL